MGEHFEKKDALEGVSQPIEFESDSIHLDIPASGVTTSDQNWTIKPLGHPQVSLLYGGKFSSNFCSTCEMIFCF